MERLPTSGTLDVPRGPTPLLVAALLTGLWACSGSNDDNTKDSSTPQDTAPEVNDTDGGTETGDTQEACETTVVEISPEDGTTEWYYRDAIDILFSDPGTAAAIQVTDGSGSAVDLDLQWESDDHRLLIYGDPYFQPSTDFTLDVSICDDSQRLTFSTSALGTPLDSGIESLVDNTYVIELTEVEFTDPPSIGFILAAYFTDPLLVGVVEATETSISLLATLGYKDHTGAYVQSPGADTWPLDNADFTTHPFFTAEADSITFTYEGADIPIENFHLEGTFTSDAQYFQQGEISGNLDTRYLGELLGGDQNTACEWVAVAGIECEACSDGEPYCLFLRAIDILAPLEEGLVLEASE